MSLRSTCFIDGAFFLAKTNLLVLGLFSLSARISRLPDHRLKQFFCDFNNTVFPSP
jgi:hypothetical protein